MNKNEGLKNVAFDEMADFTEETAKQIEELSLEAGRAAGMSAGTVESWASAQERMRQIIRQAYITQGGVSRETIERCLEIMGDSKDGHFAGLDINEEAKQRILQSFDSAKLNMTLRQSMAETYPELNRKQRRALLAKARKAK